MIGIAYLQFAMSLGKQLDFIGNKILGYNLIAVIVGFAKTKCAKWS